MATLKLILTLGSTTHSLPAPKEFSQLIPLVRSLFKLPPAAEFRIDFSPSAGKSIRILDQTSYVAVVLSSGQPAVCLTLGLDSGKDEFELVEAVLEQSEIATKKVGKSESKGETSTQTAGAKTADFACGDTTLPTVPQYTNTEQVPMADTAVIASPEQAEKATQSPAAGDQIKDGEQCPLCSGNKKQDKEKCLLCLGSGKIAKELARRMQSLIQREVAAKLPLPAPKLDLAGNAVMKSQLIAAFAKGAQKAVHAGAKCDACGATPIVGSRFKCTICTLFDLCESCEAVITHEHPMIKFRVPEKAAAATVPAPVYKVAAEAEPKYYAKCIHEGLNEGQTIRAGSTFSGVWRVMNTGETKWPKDTVLSSDPGEVKVLSVQVGEVPSGGHIDLCISMTAPTKPGKYVAFFQLSHSKGKTFGQKFWADLNVVAKGEEEEKKEKKKLEESTMEEKKMMELVKKLSRLSIPETYVENVMKLAQMYMGIEPEAIFEMLKKYENNAEIVANLLLNQA